MLVLLVGFVVSIIVWRSGGSLGMTPTIKNFSVCGLAEDFYFADCPFLVKLLQSRWIYYLGSGIYYKGAGSQCFSFRLKILLIGCSLGGAESQKTHLGSREFFNLGKADGQFLLLWHRMFCGHPKPLRHKLKLLVTVELFVGEFDVPRKPNIVCLQWRAFSRRV